MSSICFRVTLPRMIRYTQLVYSMMIGSMMTTTQNMMLSVLWLDTASQIVRLLLGASEEGMMNGNKEAPAVRMMPVTLKPLDRNAAIALLAVLNTTHSKAPATAMIGKAQMAGQRA